MPIAQDMKNITEDIEVSYGERVAFLSDLFKETDNTLKTFRRNHQKMATDLWDFLTSDRGSREKLIQTLRGENKKELAAMAEKLTNFLKNSRTTMKQETANLISQIREDLGSMAKETRAELTSATKKRIEEVKKTIKAFAAEHQARSNKLRQELSDSQKKLEKTVKEMRAEVKSDLKEAKQNWQNLAKIMVAKRSGKLVVLAKRVEGVPQREVAEAAKAFTEGGLKEQAMRLIVESPGGITLSQMGKTLKIPYIRLAKPVSELARDGRVKKENSQYFPA